MDKKELRRHPRRYLDCPVCVTWQDEQGCVRSVTARASDVSASGARIEFPEPLAVDAWVVLKSGRAELTNTARVRHCTRRGSKYMIGLEVATPEGQPTSEADSTDYYELMQISPNAEFETVQRVYRLLAARYHPDNPETGNNEMFLRLRRAYETLSDPVQRLAYDNANQGREIKPLPIFELKEFLHGVDGEVNRRMGILCLLYNRRRRAPDKPGLSVLDLETIMALPREHLMFALWYLREKEFVRREETCEYSVTAEGTDFLESRLPVNRLFYKLLQAPDPDGRREEASQAAAGQRDIIVM